MHMISGDAPCLIKVAGRLVNMIVFMKDTTTVQH